MRFKKHPFLDSADRYMMKQMGMNEDQYVDWLESLFPLKQLPAQPATERDLVQHTAHAGASLMDNIQQLTNGTAPIPPGQYNARIVETPNGKLGVAVASSREAFGVAGTETGRIQPSRIPPATTPAIDLRDEVRRAHKKVLAYRLAAYKAREQLTEAHPYSRIYNQLVDRVADTTDEYLTEVENLRLTCNVVREDD